MIYEYTKMSLKADESFSEFFSHISRVSIYIIND